MTLLADLKEGMRISAEAMRGNLMRSILTTLGIVIGVVTVSLMATALEWLDRAFHNSISFLGSDVLYIDRQEWFVDSRAKWESSQRRNKITMTQVRALERELTGVLAIAPMIQHWVNSVQYGDRSSPSVMVIGTSEQFLLTGGITLSAGRFLTKIEAFANRDLCVIGSEVATKLFPGESPLAKKIRISGQPMEVIGVLEKRGSALGRMSLDNQVIIPVQKMIRGFRWEPSFVIQVKVGDTSRVESAREELRGVMRKIRKVRPGADDDFAINQQEALIAQFRTVSLVVATAGFFITGLSLFVGGIGIMNIMFVSVTERTHEIGIRKAIGARKRTILLQFLLEAVAICLIGGFIALAIAATIVKVTANFYPDVELSAAVALLALAVAIGTGVISGFVPAWRAAGMRPVDALRKE